MEPETYLHIVLLFGESVNEVLEVKLTPITGTVVIIIFPRMNFLTVR